MFGNHKKKFAQRNLQPLEKCSQSRSAKNVAKITDWGRIFVSNRALSQKNGQHNLGKNPIASDMF